MKFGTTCLLVIGILAMSHGVWAATISGIVYNGLTLETQKDSVLTIDTTPVQMKVSKYGAYSFIVENGMYTIEGTYRENGVETLFDQRTITVENDGEYTVDMILLPRVGALPIEPLPGEETQPTIFDQLLNGPGAWMVIMIIILAVIIFAIWDVHLTRLKQRSEKNRSEIFDKKIKIENEMINKMENEKRMKKKSAPYEEKITNEKKEKMSRYQR